MSAPLRDHIAAGYVIYEYTNVTHTKYAQGFTSGLDRFLTTAQGVTYRDCLQRHGRRHTFVGFVDIDELVVLEDPAVVDINQMLREYERLGGLSAYWRLLGSSGHVTRPRRGASAGAGGSGTTVSSYTACLPRGRPENTQFKSFVNTRCARKALKLLQWFGAACRACSAGLV